MSEGTDPNLVRVRVIASEEQIKRVAHVIADALEKEGVVVLEWGRPYPCDQPDADKRKLYITGLVRKFATAQPEIKYEPIEGEQP